MGQVDKILKIFTEYLFSDLQKEDRAILKRLAVNGPQNLSELDNHLNFRRWSIKRRLEGTEHFLGLIPNEFVRPIHVNNKETRYDLTMKGLIAVLTEKRFENVHLVKTYKEFLIRKIKKAKLVNWSLDFIKFEIALIVSYHYLQGLDWTRFKLVQNYWDDFKENDVIGMQVIIDPLFIKQNHASEEYEYVVYEYLKLFAILDLCTVPISLGDQSALSILKIDQTGRKFIDRWYHYLDHDESDKILKERQRIKTDMPNILKSYKKYTNAINREAREIVARNGYEISGRT